MAITAQEIVAKTGELPLFPVVASKVMKMVSDPKTSAKDLQEVIITDQAMTARILKISNSAMFGLKREVKTLTQAIMLLGFNTIRSIVIAAAAKKVFNKASTTGFKERLIWQNAMGCALIARIIAEKLNNLNKEEAFIGGLMHNVGKTVLNSYLGEGYTDLIQRAYNENLHIQDLEREALGFDHCEVGYIILKNWNLSSSLADAVHYYTQPDVASEENQPLTAVISLASMYCWAFGLGTGHAKALESQDLSIIFDILKLDLTTLEKWKEMIEVKVKEDMDMFQTI